MSKIGDPRVDAKGPFDRQQAAGRLRGLLLEGASSPPTVPVDAAWFESLRERARRRAP